jgi:hypothetical protein
MFPLRSFRSIALPPPTSLQPPEVISLFPASELNLMRQESFSGRGVSITAAGRDGGI